MMYHLSSFLQGEQIVHPETKHNLAYKKSWVDLLYNNQIQFFRLYADDKVRQEIERETGWQKSKLFCECIFELCRKNIDEKQLYPRLESLYLSESIEAIEDFKLHSNRKGTIFEVNVDIEQCQKYDLILFSIAENYLHNQPVLTEDVFVCCYQIAYAYWNGLLSKHYQFEYLYYGEAKFKPIIIE